MPTGLMSRVITLRAIWLTPKGLALSFDILICPVQKDKNDSPEDASHLFYALLCVVDDDRSLGVDALDFVPVESEDDCHSCQHDEDECCNKGNEVQSVSAH